MQALGHLEEAMEVVAGQLHMATVHVGEQRLQLFAGHVLQYHHRVVAAGGGEDGGEELTAG